MANDLSVRELRQAGARQIHLLFAEPLRLDDGRSYTWVLCDLDKGSIRGIPGAPVIPVPASRASALQFDAAGNGYYFAADGRGGLTLFRLALDPVAGGSAAAAEELRGIGGQQVRSDWLVLPDKTVLLSLFRPETAQTSYSKVSADGRSATPFAGGFSALLRSGALTGSRQNAVSERFKAYRDRLLAAGGASLAQGEWPALQWQSVDLGAVSVADMAVDAAGNTFIAGSELPDGRPGLWAVDRLGSRCLARLPQPCLRVAVLSSPAEEAREESPGSPVSGAAAEAGAVPFTCEWNTLLYANGLHKVSAVATDEAGGQARDEIVVRVANVGLSLSGERFSDHSWLITKEYIRIRLVVDNSAGAPVAKYVVYRRSGGSESVFKELLPGDVPNGRCEFIMPVSASQAATYRVVAMDAGGVIIGASDETTM